MLVLAFYTGSGSNYANCGSAVEVRKANNETIFKDYNSDKYVDIIYYLILALSKIEFFWGEVERWINLKEENGDFELYTPGNIVTWI